MGARARHFAFPFHSASRTVTQRKERNVTFSYVLLGMHSVLLRHELLSITVGRLNFNRDPAGTRLRFGWNPPMIRSKLDRDSVET